MEHRSIVAAVARRPRAPFTIEDLTLSGPAPNEVLVRIAGVGICHTDLVVRDSNFPPALPAVLGHEGSGIVEETGTAVRGLKRGDRVILSYGYCGACRHCSHKHPGYCDEAGALNYSGQRESGPSALHDQSGPIAGHFFGQSSFASHVVTQPRNVTLATSSAPIAMLGPFGCSLQTGAGTVFNALDPTPGSAMLITGAGAVGLAAVMAAAATDCDPIIVSDPLPERRAIATELGATHTLDPIDGPLLQQVRDVSPHGVEQAVDTTGLSSVMRGALGALSKRGTLAAVGIAPGSDPSLEVSINHMMTSGHRIIGVVEGDGVPQEFIPRLLELHDAGRFPFEKLMTPYPFERINEAISEQAAGLCVKPVLVFNDVTF